jgi:YggT family protein
VEIICYLLDAFLIAVFLRIILTWFPITPGGAMAQAFSVLYTITEPVMGPLRRIIPPIGGAIDISPIIIIFGIQIITGAILNCGVGLL